MMKMRGYSQRKMSEQIGRKPTYMCAMLARKKTPYVSNLLELCDACDFDLCIVDRQNREDVTVITNGETLQATTDERRE